MKRADRKGVELCELDKSKKSVVCNFGALKMRVLCKDGVKRVTFSRIEKIEEGGMILAQEITVPKNHIPKRIRSAFLRKADEYLRTRP